MPARLRDIKRALTKRGIQVLEPKGGGSHWKATNGQVTYPIPSHGGLHGEITDVYIKGLCRAFGFDLAEFKRDL